jgi:hypothetical protein
MSVTELHSPLPWHSDQNDQGELYDATGYCIADNLHPHDAELIAHSVNTRAGQSRTASLLETATHITIGFVIALWLTKELFPQLSYTDNARITTIFTAVSLVRGFVIRRIFNWLTVNE